MLLTQTIYISNFAIILPLYLSTPPQPTSITMTGAIIKCKKLLMQSYAINVSTTVIQTFPNVCLYQILNLVDFTKVNGAGLIEVLEQVIASPISVVFYADQQMLMEDSTLVATIVGIYSNFSSIVNSVINTTASACLTNLGLGKGL